jgi:hypothetical protein
MTVLNIENQRGFTILSAILSTDRTDQSVDIAGSILDFDIYEHLDKPYLTANFIFSDQYGLVELIDMQGVEKLALKIESINKNIISKDFRIVKISKATKGNDRGETVFLDAVEEHAYISNAINVNKAYVGSPGSIIKTIAKEQLDKVVMVNNETYQGNMKVIVPNKNPIEAMKWFQQRATNQDGLPYYIYSTLYDNNLIFDHLGTMLTREPNNIDKPYVYSQAPSGYNNNTKEYYTIESYKYENIENMFSMINKGFAGAQYEFFNLSDGFPQKAEFNAKEDIFDNIKNKNYLNQNQNHYNYPTSTKIKDKDLSKQKAKYISRITAGNTFTGYGDFKTYGEEATDTAYKKNIIGDALKYYLTKSPLSISVNGTPFLMDGGNLTIGTVIRLKFFDSNIAVDRTNMDIGIDTKKSGDYIIYAARHSFKVEKYDINLLCTKIANYTGETL